MVHRFKLNFSVLNAESIKIEGVEYSLSKNGTVIDITSFDSNLTPEEFKILKEQYTEKARKIGLKGKIDFKYRWKCNFNKYEELKKLGVDFKEAGKMEGAYNYIENSIYSDFIILGKIVKETVFTSYSKYEIKIEIIIKGKKLLEQKLKKTPKRIDFLYDSGYEEMVSYGTKPNVNKRALFFLQLPFSIKNIKKDAQIKRVTYSTIIIEDGNSLYKERNYNKILAVENGIKIRKAKFPNHPKRWHSDAADKRRKLFKLEENLNSVLKNINEVLKIN